MHLVESRVVDFRIFLRDKKDLLVVTHSNVQRLDRLVPADKQRDHHVWINNNIP